jgi:hypothetical protein
VATLDDYANVHSAFDGDLANLYGKASETTVAVVRAIEDMGGAKDLSVKVTLRELAKRLGIVSLNPQETGEQREQGDKAPGERTRI